MVSFVSLSLSLVLGDGTGTLTVKNVGYVAAVASVFAALVLLLLAKMARSTKHTFPKGFQRNGNGNAALANGQKKKRGKKDCTREAFRPKKLPEEIDYVVIGSGMGSLYCAGLLARAGKRVVMLEQHYVAGGCTHSFEDKGYEFDTGLHYVGRMEKYKQLIDLVSFSGKHTDKNVQWAKMGTEKDGYCYDEILLKNPKEKDEVKPFKLCAGEKVFIDNLVKKFPKEEAAIREYVRLVKRVNKLADMYFYGKLFHPWIQWFLNKFVNGEYFKWAGKNTWDVISELTDDKELRSLLCGQFGDYGLHPRDASFLIQAGIAAHYLDGAYYPVGGSQEISRAIIPTIEEAGGAVFVKAKVAEILIDERGRAVGVKMAKKGGDDSDDDSDDESVCVYAKYGVVSGAGAVATNTLVPEKGGHRERLGYAPMLEAVKPSISHVYAFIGMKGTTEELGLRAANLWVLPVNDDWDYVGNALDDTDKTRDSTLGDPWENVGDTKELDDMLLFAGFPSVKDPSFAKRFPGKSTCELITTAHPEWFSQYLDDTKKGNKSGKRNNAEYALLKKRLEKKLLLALYRHYPQCEGKVDYVDIGTPLTNLYYLGRPDSYGLEHTPGHYAGSLDKMRPQTAIPGLWVTGQDVGTVGIVGALNGGILTAHNVLGYSFWDLVIAKRNLIEDIMAMDKAYPPAEMADKKAQ
jgi:all-trans-retinol 13,14-reductase